MDSPYPKIIELLKKDNVEYEEVSHEPVFTSEQAAAIRGFGLSQGAKSLLVKVDDKFVLIIIPGDKRLDSKKVKKLLNIKDIRFATPEEVVKIMGCEIGACFPFGSLIDVPMYVDKTLAENSEIGFNPGVHDKSIKISWQNYAKITNPKLVEVVQEV